QQSRRILALGPAKATSIPRLISGLPANVEPTDTPSLAGAIECDATVRDEPDLAGIVPQRAKLMSGQYLFERAVYIHYIDYLGMRASGLLHCGVRPFVAVRHADVFGFGWRGSA